MTPSTALTTVLVTATLAAAACQGGTPTPQGPVDAGQASESAATDAASEVPTVLALDLEAARLEREAARHTAASLEDPGIVRGVYSTKWSFWGERWERLLDLVATTELNAIVVDVKDDGGQLSWAMDLELASSPGAADWAASMPTLEDAQARVQQLLDLGGYPIARVVCFKDSSVATANPALAVRDVRDGGPWQGHDGQHWLNPYQPDAWQYCVDVGKQAAEAGFREVQFDYVRFPNGGDGPSKHFSFPGMPDDRPEDEWRHPEEIRRFLASATAQLHEVGVRVSADVFGLTTYNFSWNGDGTGQVWEQLVEELDYISPMTYPSHYAAGNYGLYPHPVQHPYQLIYEAMEEAQLRTFGTRAGIRPWLEDFGAPWLRDSVPHTAERVRQQIQAAYDRGIDSWLLWNAGNTYSVDALAEALASHAVAWSPDVSSVGGGNGDARDPEQIQAIIDRGPEVETPSERRAREEREAAEASPTAPPTTQDS